MVSSIVLPQQSKEINQNGLAHLIPSDDPHSILLQKEKKNQKLPTVEKNKHPQYYPFPRAPKEKVNQPIKPTGQMWVSWNATLTLMNSKVNPLWSYLH